LQGLDSGFRRNDGKTHFQTFYECISFAIIIKNSGESSKSGPLKKIHFK